MSIYRAPDPPLGPDRTSDAYPLTDFAEVAALRREFTGRYRVWLPIEAVRELGPEQFDSHEEYEAARDAERWGDDPFGEE